MNLFAIQACFTVLQNSLGACESIISKQSTNSSDQNLVVYLTLVWSFFIIQVNPGMLPHVVRTGK